MDCRGARFLHRTSTLPSGGDVRWEMSQEIRNLKKTTLKSGANRSCPRFLHRTSTLPSGEDVRWDRGSGCQADRHPPSDGEAALERSNPVPLTKQQHREPEGHDHPTDRVESIDFLGAMGSAEGAMAAKPSESAKQSRATDGAAAS